MSRTHTIILMLLLAALVVYSNRPVNIEPIEIHTKCRDFEKVVIYYPPVEGKCRLNNLSWYTPRR